MHPLAYTPEEDNSIRTLLSEGKSKAEIAEFLGRSKESVKNYLFRMAVKKNFISITTANPAVEIVLPGLKSGKTVSEMALTCGWREVTIRRWARRFCAEGKLSYKEEYEQQSRNGHKRYSEVSKALGLVERRVVRAFIDYRIKCSKKALHFDLDVDWVNEQFKLQDGRCYYTKAILSSESSNKRLATVDRLDSTKGYTKDNCVLACYAANVAKGVLSVESFIRMCHAVSQVHPL